MPTNVESLRSVPLRVLENGLTAWTRTERAACRWYREADLDWNEVPLNSSVRSLGPLAERSGDVVLDRLLVGVLDVDTVERLLRAVVGVEIRRPS